MPAIPESVRMEESSLGMRHEALNMEQQQQPSSAQEDGKTLLEVNLSEPAVSRLRRTPAWGAAVNSISFMCMPRGIPACFAATGWPLGLLCLLYSSVVTYETGCLIGKVCAVLPGDISSFPAIAAEAAGSFSASRGHDALHQARWRYYASWAIAILQHSCYYLTGVSEIFYFQQYLGQLFDKSGLCQWQWLLLVGVICLPAMQVPSFHTLRISALILGILPLIFNVGIFLYEIVGLHESQASRDLPYAVLAIMHKSQ